MHKSLINRREQMVSDGVQRIFGALYTVRCRPHEKPIDLPMDLSEDGPIADERGERR